jgi:alpha/beta superfamily hydrolase
MQHLCEVFLRLRVAMLRLRAKKCSLLQPKVHLLGYVISSHGSWQNGEGETVPSAAGCDWCQSISGIGILL